MNRSTLPWIVLGIALVFGASQTEIGRKIEGFGAIFALPIVLSVLAFGRLRSAEQPLLQAGVLVLALSALSGELNLGGELFPGEPIASASLSRSEADATLPVPDSTRYIVVETRAAVGHGVGDVEGSAQVTFERGALKKTVNASYSRHQTAARATRRRVSTGSSQINDIDRDVLDMPASGPVKAHLDSLSSGLGSQLEVSVSAESMLLHYTQIALWVLAVAALAVDGAAARFGLRTLLAPAVAIIGVFSVYLPLRYNPADPLGSAIGTALIAVVIGGIGGMLANLVVRGLVPKAA